MSCRLSVWKMASTGGLVLAVCGAFGQDSVGSTSNADKALNASISYVVNSPVIAPSHDPHDYVTLATYAWPNPNTPNGLPYVLKDGEVSKELGKYPDQRYLNQMLSAVRDLSAAYGSTHDERYARKGIDILNGWFLSPQTRMNPNLNYAQFVPGVNNNSGTPGGIIETQNFTSLVASISVLEASPNASSGFKSGIRQWFTDYLNWLRTSPNGIKQAQNKNNQLTWFTAQQVAIAEFLGNNDEARSILTAFMTNSMPNQIAPDGSQPEELKRTKGFHYSLVNLQALFELADLAKVVGIDFGHYKLSNGATLETALDFLMPYANGQKQWPYQEIHPYDPALLKAVLDKAAQVYPSRRVAYQQTQSAMKVF